MITKEQRKRSKQVAAEWRAKKLDWETWNAQTYEATGAEPMSQQYKRDFDHPYPIALISLFTIESLGIRALYPFLREAGHDVDLIFLKEYATNHFEMPTEHELQLLFDLIKKRGYKVIGIGARSGYIKFCCELTARIHEETGATVVWGGTVGTVTPDLCIKGGADYAIQDEGEVALAELINCLATDKDPRHIYNLWYKGEDGEPVGNPLRNLIPSLDVLPIQDLEDNNKYFIEWNKLTQGDPWRNVIKFETITARGCPYKCSFCIHSQLVKLEKGLGKSVRGASVEKVTRELEYALNKLPNMKSIFFADEVFGTGSAWTTEFGEVYPHRIGLPFELAIDPRALTDIKVAALVKAGLAELNMGIQAGSEKIRAELFDRPVSDTKLLEVASLMKKHKVFTRYDIIVDNPWETSADKRKTLDILLQLPHPFILNMFSLNWFPKTGLTERALNDGIIDDSQVAGESEKSLTQFTVSYDYDRPKEDTLWNALYAMTSKSFVPRSFIRMLAVLPLARRYPVIAVVCARVSTLTRLAYDSFFLFLQGRIDLNTVRRFRKSVSGITR
jgi:anaerobic magnesium-protoporphyrin IX monomethyl ester cyclase